MALSHPLEAATATTAEIVRANLDLHHLWTALAVREVPLAGGRTATLVRGTPPEKLYRTDAAAGAEWVLPAVKEASWTVAQWAEVFAALDAAAGGDAPPQRVLMAMLSTDSTVVYYFVHRGLIKPRKN
ncbi:tRNA-splicing endonuclease subunit Sen15 [Dipodascopsis tothii]|uniref:tRNA-splicing endonuclease subunit Sen15 n=1 Tax=Dipodascopsis tothii TaxID=44089 RepID=UPI0034CFA928